MRSVAQKKYGEYEYEYEYEYERNGITHVKNPGTGIALYVRTYVSYHTMRRLVRVAECKRRASVVTEITRVA